MATKPRIGAVDQRLDSQALAHQDMLGELRKATDAKNDLIVMLAKINRAEMDPGEWNEIVFACAKVNDSLNAAGIYLGSAMAETLALRDEPAVRRARKETRKDNEERRQRERRQARRWSPSEVAA